MKVEVIEGTASELAEGPVWVNGRFWWVDINGRQFKTLRDDGVKSWDLPDRAGAAVPTTDGRFVLCTERGVEAFDPETEQISELNDYLAGEINLRHNDAKCDPRGRLWLGTQSFDNRPSASLNRLRPPHGVCRYVEGVRISNGLAWSGDGATMYYIDSPTGRIDAFDYDLDRGDIAVRRPVYDAADVAGGPDGMTIDADGNLWVGFWGGSCVRCIDPRTGEVLEKVDTPATNTTSCCFGGDDLRTLYITSALDITEPHSGHIFTCRPGATGLPVDLVELNP